MIPKLSLRAIIRFLVRELKIFIALIPLALVILILITQWPFSEVSFLYLEL